MWRTPGAPVLLARDAKAVAIQRWDGKQPRREPINSEYWRSAREF
jgi:hypothetical protein